MYKYKEHFDYPFHDSFLCHPMILAIRHVSIHFCEIHAEKCHVFLKTIFNIHMIFIKFICILHA